MIHYLHTVVVRNMVLIILKENIGTMISKMLDRRDTIDLEDIHTFMKIKIDIDPQCMNRTGVSDEIMTGYIIVGIIIIDIVKNITYFTE